MPGRSAAAGGRANALLETARNLTAESSICSVSSRRAKLLPLVAHIVQVEAADDVQPFIELHDIRIVAAMHGPARLIVGNDEVDAVVLVRRHSSIAISTACRAELPSADAVVAAGQRPDGRVVGCALERDARHGRHHVARVVGQRDRPATPSRSAWRSRSPDWPAGRWWWRSWSARLASCRLASCRPASCRPASCRSEPTPSRGGRRRRLGGRRRGRVGGRDVCGRQWRVGRRRPRPAPGRHRAAGHSAALRPDRTSSCS